MNFYQRTCLQWAIACIVLFIAQLSHAQSFNGTLIAQNPSVLSTNFTQSEVYRIDANAFDSHVKSNTESNITELHLGDHDWKLNLYPSRITKPGQYKLQVQTDNGIIETYPTEQKAFQGTDLNGGGKVRLTVDEGFIYGYVHEADKTYFIEPLRYFDPTADDDLFVVYERLSVIRNTAATCQAVEMEESMQEHADDDPHHNNNGQAEMGCYELDIAIASDKSMFTKYFSSVTQVENHNIAVMNDVQGNYTGNFIHNLEFVIVTQFVVTGTDPWTTSLNAGTLLNSFRDWAQAGNFGTTHDLGELWTNRDFSGGTVGIAFVNALCTSFKYHCLQDFTNDGEQLRCMTTHEIGHNLNCNHDNQGGGTCPPDFIMCPFVSTTNNWSTGSINTINAYLPTKINSNCLTVCSGGQAIVADFDWDPDPGCKNQTVQFNNLSTGTITGYSWMFTGGSPATSTAQNPVVTWANAGTFTVKLTVAGTGGPVIKTKTITIIAAPVANFTSSVVGTTVTFINTTTGGGNMSYNWDFGDGNSSTDPNPVYTYDIGGTYSVILTATNSCGTSTRTINVNTAPTADFSAIPTAGCVPLDVQFNNLSTSNALTYLWQFQGGSPQVSTQINPDVTYLSPGTYSVTLTAINTIGNNVLTKVNYITVGAQPTTGFNFSVNGLTVNFTNTSTNATTYLWDFGDGNTSTLSNPTHTYSVGGSYSVSLTATNVCGDVTLIKTVGLLAAPQANFSATPTSGCASLSVQFTNQSTGAATTYNWEFQGGNPATSSVANPTVLYSTPGVYSVTLTAGNSAGTNTFVQTNYITVASPPTAAFTNTTAGATVTFTNTTASVAGGGNNTYSWNFGDNSTSTLVNPVHTYASDGTYTVVLSASNTCGTSTSTKTVVITTPPTANFTGANISGCPGLMTQFTNTSSANATSFAWQFPGGTPTSSTATNPLVTYNTPGVYSVILTATNSAGSNTITRTNYITVNSTPNAGFSSTSNGFVATFTNSSTNASTYSWNFGDGNTSTLTNPVHTYTADGTYTVVLTATNACGTTTSTKTVVIVTPPAAGFTANNTLGCAPLLVQFTNTSSSNATTFAWEFPGGNPSTSSAPNVSVVYNTPGSYSVTLTAGNTAGTTTVSQMNLVTVTTVPNAGFTSVTNGSTATFTNSSTNANSYSWNFGDGNTSTLPSPSHTYAGDGTYTVVLTATNFCGTTTYTQNVVIITEPDAGFTANITTGCAPLTVQFMDLSSDNTTAWAWTFPGGSPSSSTAQNPTVVYEQPGTYDVTLSASTTAGNSIYSQTGFITVLTTPSVSFSGTTSGNTVAFTNTSTGASSYSWSFGDGSTSTEANPVHTYMEDGIYSVILTATNICGSVSQNQLITIVTPPTASFTTDQTAGCGPLTVHFTNTASTNATAFAWTFENGTPASSSEASPISVWDLPGVYLVTMIASNSAGSDTAYTNITVNALPTAQFTYQTAGLSAVMNNGSINAGSYLWDFGDGTTGTDQNPVHNYSTVGNYTVILAATNACGTVYYTAVITISGTPPIPGILANPANGCMPLSVAFTDQSTGNPTAWQWTFENGTPPSSTLQNPSVTYSTPGIYAVTLASTNAFGTQTTVFDSAVTVFAFPNAAFGQSIIGGMVTFSNQSTNADSYAWNFGDGTPTTNELNPTHTYALSGTYTVTLTAINVCGASTLQQTITITVVGTEEVAWINRFVLYPNPNQGRFEVDMQATPAQVIYFELHNALGQLIGRETSDFKAGVLKKSLDYGTVASGFYTLTIRAGANVSHVKVVIER